MDGSRILRGALARKMGVVRATRIAAQGVVDVAGRSLVVLSRPAAR